MNKFKNLSKREKAEYIAVIALYPLIWLFAQLGKVCRLFNTQKRQITASVLSLAMVITMLPIMSLTAFAAGATGVTIGNVALDAANPYYHNGTNGTQGTADNNPAGANATFTAAEGNNPAVLTLNNLNLNIASGDGVKITGGEVKIMLTDGTQNNSPKIYCSSKLTITGGGELNVTTSNDDDYGIYSLGALTITGTTVKVVCSDSTKGISAVFTGGSSMVIEDSKLDATSGKDTGSSNTSNSCGVRSNGEITVKGTSVVTATAKDSANGKSWGMAANGGITIKDTAVVTATAGNSTLSYGIVGQQSVTISGGTVVASGNTGALNRAPNLTDVSALGSTSVDGSDADTYDSGKYSTYKWFMSEKLSEAGASDETWSQGSYTATNDITLSSRITISGTVTLRIPNGVKITANKGFEIDKGSTLIIYGPGELVAYPRGYFTPAFGCTSGSVNQCGDLVIHSGTVTASGDLAYGYNIRVNHLTMDGGTLTAWARGCIAMEVGAADIADTLKIFANYTGNPAATENAASTIKDNASYDFSNYAVEIRPAALHTDLYAVTLNTNGGTVNSGNLTSYTSGTATKLPTDVSKDGFVLNGWYDNADCTGTAVTEIPASATGHKTYYAKWDEKVLGTLTASDFTFTPPTALAYDGTAKTASVIVKDGVNAGTVTVKYYDANGDLLSDAPKNAGTYTVKIDASGSEDYEPISDLTDAAWTFTVEPRKITVTASPNQSKYYGVADSAFTYVCGSAVSGETPAFNGALTRDEGEAVNTYAIRKGTLVLKDNGTFKTANYVIDFTGADFSIREYAPIAAATLSPDGDNGWFKTGTVILTAPTGFKISTSNALTGNTWSDSITLDGTNGAGKAAAYYLKNIETGAVSTAAEADYKVDTVAPTNMKVQYNENGFKSFLNTITFGIFFKESVDVTANATDVTSGVASYQYYASDTEIDDFTGGSWQNSLSLTPNSKKIVYIKVTDKAGNEIITNNEGIVVYSDSTVSPTTATFDKNVANQTDVDFTLSLNDNTLCDIKNGSSVLTSGTDYTVSGNTVTVKKAYLAAQPNGNVTLTFSFYPMGVVNEDTLSTATATITVSDSTHRHSLEHTTAVAATCTTDGNSEYWHCTGCGNYFSDENGTNAITLESTVLKKLGHSFTSYTYNNDATYEKDGTETAHCDRDGCTATDTRTASGTKLIDTTAPTGKIKISNNSFENFVNSITFGLFFKESQAVTITGEDAGIGLDKIYYCKSEIALTLDKVKALSADKWTEGDSLTISPDWQGVVYAKLTDKSGNALYLSSDGLVLDAASPVIAGVTDGGQYCNTATVLVTVTETNLASVTLNGTNVSLTDGKLTVYAKGGAQKIVVTDKAGNETTATITVYADHVWDDGKVTKAPTAAEKGEKTYTCAVCGETKTEEIAELSPEIIDGNNGEWKQGSSDGMTFKSNATLSDLESVSVDGKVIDKANYTTAEGSTVVTLKAEYLATLSAGKHTLAINSTTGTASTEFTIAAKAVDPEKPGDSTKPGDTDSPQTGDSSNMLLWLSLLLVSGGALTALGITKKRNRAIK